MKVVLRTLKDNPTRDFRVDPIDDVIVATLKQSVKDHGFWGGIVCRKKDQEIQIAAGHHRVRAAIAAGVKEADVFVATDMSDAAMIRVYAEENATQRGSSAGAQAGSVAATTRYVAKIMLGDQGYDTLTKFSQGLGLTDRAIQTIRGNLVTDRGIGQDVIVRFLKNVPGVNKSMVEQQLAVLKDSGNYARIIAEVRAEIERETQDAETLALAQRASEAANNRPVTFDLTGVAPHFNNSHQVDVFRSIVTREAAQQVLPVRNQSRIAAQLARDAERSGVELSGTYISDRVESMISEARSNQQQISRVERRVRESQDWEVQSTQKQRAFISAIERATEAAKELAAHERRRPEDARLSRIAGFAKAIRDGMKLGELCEGL